MRALPRAPWSSSPKTLALLRGPPFGNSGHNGRGPWVGHAEAWLACASRQENTLAPRLVVPKSLLDSIPPHDKEITTEIVCKYQYRALARVSKRRQALIPYSPPPKVSPLELTRHHPVLNEPRMKVSSLWNQASAPLYTQPPKRQNRPGILRYGTGSSSVSSFPNP